MSLEKITQVTGRGVPIPGDDIDTDRIIPARFMKCVTFDGLGEFAFADARAAARASTGTNQGATNGLLIFYIEGENPVPDLQSGDPAGRKASPPPAAVAC